jgi:hypothetical protein
MAVLKKALLLLLDVVALSMDFARVVLLWKDDDGRGTSEVSVSLLLLLLLPYCCAAALTRFFRERNMIELNWTELKWMIEWSNNVITSYYDIEWGGLLLIHAVFTVVMEQMSKIQMCVRMFCHKRLIYLSQQQSTRPRVPSLLLLLLLLLWGDEGGRCESDGAFWRPQSGIMGRIVFKFSTLKCLTFIIWPHIRGFCAAVPKWICLLFNNPLSETAKIVDN